MDLLSYPKTAELQSPYLPYAEKLFGVFNLRILIIELSIDFCPPLGLKEANLSMDYAIVTETLLAGCEDVFIYKTMIQTPFCEKFSI